MDESIWLETAQKDAQPGMWRMILELEKGIRRMYIDERMAYFLGIGKEENFTPEACYEYWYKRISKGYHEYVNMGLEELLMTGRDIEMQYIWEHPQYGGCLVRCGCHEVVRENQEIWIEGYHQILDGVERPLAIKYGDNYEVVSFRPDLKRLKLHTGGTSLYGRNDVVENFPDSWVENGMVHPLDRETLVQLFTFPENRSETKQGDVRLRVRDGSYEWFSVYLKRDGKEGAGSSSVLGELVNVEKEKRKESNYQRSRIFQRHLLERTESFAEVDLQDNRILSTGGGWEYFNRQPRKAPYSEMMEQYFRRMNLTEEEHRYYAALERDNLLACFEKGKRYMRFPDEGQENSADSRSRETMGGENLEIWLEKEPVSGHVYALITQWSAEYGCQDAERKAEEKMEQLSEFWGDMSYLIDPDSYEITAVNQSLLRQLHLKTEECIGRKCYELLWHRDSPCSFCEKLRWNRHSVNCFTAYFNRLEKTMLFKNRLIYHHGNIGLLTQVVDFQNDATVLSVAEEEEWSDRLLINTLRNMCSVEKKEDLTGLIFGALKEYYEPQRILLTRCEAEDSCLNVEAQWQEDGRQALEEQDFSAAFSDWAERRELLTAYLTNSREEILTVSYEAFRFLEKQEIYNLLVIPYWSRDGHREYIFCLNMQIRKEKIGFADDFSHFINMRIGMWERMKEQEYLLYHDKKTGLMNREGFYQYEKRFLTEEYASLGVVSLDINGLGKINDRYGTSAGDKAVSNIAQAAVECFGAENCYHLDGDELLIICTDEKAEAFEERTKRLENLIENLQLSAAIGKCWDKSHRELMECVTNAQSMMRLDKYRYYETADGVEETGRSGRVAEVLQALENNQFIMFLQPKLELKSGRITGAEALVRFRDKENRISLPGRFVGMMEQTGLISYVDYFMLEEVFKWLSLRRKQEKELVHVSVNFSRQTLLESDMFIHLESVIKKYDVPLSMVEIEVTETLGEVGGDVIADVVRRLKGMGFSIALDDFGARYSNLSVLSEVPFDTLKLDQSLIWNLDNKEDQVSPKIIEAVLEMCGKLGICTVAEGVETRRQAQLLEQLHCMQCQGYLYGRPMDADSFAEMLDKQPYLRKIQKDSVQTDRQQEPAENVTEQELAINECLKMLHASEQIDDDIGKTLQELGKKLECTRVYIYETQQEIARNRYEWCAPGIVPELPNLQKVPLQNLARWISIFQKEQNIWVENPESVKEIYPDVSAWMQSHGIHSVLAVPLLRGKHLLGFLGIENLAPERQQKGQMMMELLAFFFAARLEERCNQEVLKKLSYMDVLTHSYNRNAYIVDLESVYKRSGKSLGVIFADVNGLKNINDKEGHRAGDARIRAVADVIRSVFENERIYRIGGDEFIIFCVGYSQQRFGEKVKLLEEKIAMKEQIASVGSAWSAAADQADRLVKEADDKMYRVKRRNGSTCRDVNK